MAEVYTEAEARKLFCPMLRSRLCLCSGCMAWVWSTWVKVDEPERTFAPSSEVSKENRTGSCGMVKEEVE